MTAWDFRRSATSAQLLVQLGQEQGLSAQECLKGTGMTPEQLADPAAEIEAHQELQVVRNLQRAARNVPGLGLKAGMRYHLTAYGIWGFAMISSPTFRSAVRVGIGYLNLTYIFNGLNSVEEGRDFRMELDDRSIPEDVRQFLVERDAAAIRLIQLELFSAAIPLKRVEFRFARPRYAAQFKKIFGVMPLFGREINALVLDSALLDRPLPRANQRTAELCERQCRDLLNQRRARTGVASQVRDRLLRAPTEMADMERVADELYMTSRTLRRKLDAEGTSFRELMDEVREALAEELLATGHLSVEDIAERLGYAESSSFIHAFKRWKGAAPRSYR